MSLGASDSPVLLIGTSHRFQLEGCGAEGDRKEFSSFLESLVKMRSVDLVAEELNEEVVFLCHAHDSVARAVARRFGVRHLFCDPDSAERKRLGIKGRKEIIAELGYGKVLTREQSGEVDSLEQTYWDKRERYWLERLGELKQVSCIFILGANHIDRFCRLLDKKGLTWEVIERDWTLNE